MTRIAPDDFYLIEYFTRGDLDRHPVWRHFDEVRDREQVLQWKVAEDRLDAEVEKFRYCGTEPLYPVLALDPLPAFAGLTIRVSFLIPHADGERRLDGYLIDPHVFGIFVDERQFILNENLPDAAARQAAALADAVGADAGELFPLRYESEWVRADGRRVEGEIERFWSRVGE
jgi:hypothetical protein